MGTPKPKHTVGMLEWYTHRYSEENEFVGTCKRPVKVQRVLRTRPYHDLAREADIDDVNLIKSTISQDPSDSRYVFVSREIYRDSALQRASIGMPSPNLYLCKDDMFRSTWASKRLWHTTPELRKLIWQLTRAVRVLHEQGCPRVFFGVEDIMYQGDHIKLNYLFPNINTDILAPEERVKFRATFPKADVFRLGPAIWAVVTKDTSLPFTEEECNESVRVGARVNFRDLVAGKLEQFRLSHEMKDFLLKVVAVESARLTLDEVIIHPIVWKIKRKEEFLCTVSCILHRKRNTTEKRAARRCLEMSSFIANNSVNEIICPHADAVGERNWSIRLSSPVLQDLVMHCSYSGFKFADLLRLFRNSTAHFAELSSSVRGKISRVGGLYCICYLSLLSHRY